jgi:hypothetical protein
VSRTGHDQRPEAHLVEQVRRDVTSETRVIHRVGGQASPRCGIALRRKLVRRGQISEKARLRALAAGHPRSMLKNLMRRFTGTGASRRRSGRGRSGTRTTGTGGTGAQVGRAVEQFLRRRR